MSYKPASFALQAGWFGGAALSVVLPMVIFGVSRAQNRYYSRYQNYENNRYGYNNNNYQDDYNNTPWWYFGASNGEPGRDDDSAPAVLVAAYLWSLSIFLGIVFYGYFALRNNTSTEGIMVALLMFAAYSLISLFVFGTVEGAVETEGRAVEEHGFLGQLGVMMYLTSFCWFIFSITFAFLLRRRARRSAITKVTIDSADYKIHTENENEAV